jgi:hypothetical protein
MCCADVPRLETPIFFWRLAHAKVNREALRDVALGDAEALA